MKTKICSKCKKELPATSEYFYKRKDSKDGLYGQCRECHKIRDRNYYRKTKERRYELVRISVIKRLYGITTKQYDEMYNKQNGRCAICGIHQSKSILNRRLIIDHNHTNGEVRGLLCTHCNLLLGNAHDNKLILIKAAEYLK